MCIVIYIYSNIVIYKINICYTQFMLNSTFYISIQTDEINMHLTHSIMLKSTCDSCIVLKSPALYWNHHLIYSYHVDINRSISSPLSPRVSSPDYLLGCVKQKVNWQCRYKDISVDMELFSPSFAKYCFLLDQHINMSSMYCQYVATLSPSLACNKSLHGSETMGCSDPGAQINPMSNFLPWSSKYPQYSPIE